MEPAEVLEIFGKRATVIKPGLQRIASALEILGYPSRQTPTLTVAGTNGKGSTCGFMYRLLSACGLKVGLFSSPHLVAFRERISVSSGLITDAVITSKIRQLKSVLPTDLWADLSFFEINTILALQIFEDYDADVNVLEVGLGGRLDAVNVYDPDVAVITSIGLDHQDLLGATHSLIAREKAGVMRPGRPVIWGGPDSSHQEAHDTILKCAESVGAMLVVPRTLDSKELPSLVRSYPYFLRRNFSLAVSAVEHLIGSGRVIKLNPESLASALSVFDDRDLPWPVTLMGRFDQVEVSKGSVCRRLLIDVCHNPHGAAALARGLEEAGVCPAGVKVPCLVSILSDKDASGVWAEVKDKISAVIRFKIQASRSWTEDDQRIGGPMMNSFADAWQSALEQQDWSAQSPWLIFGSVAAVGEVFSFFQTTGWELRRKVGF